MYEEWKKLQNEEWKKLQETARPLDYKLYALFLVFLMLKLTGVINWSWWIILLPAYFIDALILVVFFFGFIWLVIKFIIDTISDKKENNNGY